MVGELEGTASPQTPSELEQTEETVSSVLLGSEDEMAPDVSSSILTALPVLTAMLSLKGAIKEPPNTDGAPCMCVCHITLPSAFQRCTIPLVAYEEILIKESDVKNVSNTVSSAKYKNKWVKTNLTNYNFCTGVCNRSRRTLRCNISPCYII